jgi:RND family efflux transporter MFP subunit
MKKSFKWWTICAVGLLCSTGLYVWSTEAAAVDATPRRTARISRQTFQQTVIATGVLRPVVGAEVDVGSRISGRVVSLPVKVGDRVRRGHLLAELDASDLEASLDQAQADLALARPRVALAESTLDRRRRLAQNGLIAPEDLEVAARDLAVEQAQLEASAARLRSAEIVLGYSKIRAPIDGVISGVSTREGETVAAGLSAPTFVTIIDLDRLEVLAYVDETDIGRIRLGQTATFTVDTYRDAEFGARVIAIQPRPELQGSVVNYVVRLEYEPLEGYVLRPEMTAHVRLLVEQREATLTVPRRALYRRDGRQFLVVQRAGDWVEQEVKIGWRSEGTVEIIHGVDEGELVELNTTS